MGSATVPVAAIGVPPMALRPEAANSRVRHFMLGLFGGTPNSARETRALPGTNSLVSARLKNFSRESRDRRSG